MAKERIDVLLTQKGRFASREKAKSAIMAGIVFVDGERVDKPGTSVENDANIEVKEPEISYVSRGGLKLEKALKFFNIDLQGKTAIDIGASTGGFTDCMLQNGAKKVVSIDVGYGQLAWELRNNPRVIVLERTNIRYLDSSKIDFLADFVTIDVSFISLKKVIPKACELSNDNAELVCLIKPQFEAGRDKVGKHGVVRDKRVHIDVIKEILEFLRNSGLQVFGLTYSPIRGPEGNIEFLVYCGKGTGVSNFEGGIEAIVEEAHGL